MPNFNQEYQNKNFVNEINEDVNENINDQILDHTNQPIHEEYIDNFGDGSGDNSDNNGNSYQPNPAITMSKKPGNKLWSKLLMALIVLVFFGIAVFATINTLASVKASQSITTLVPEIQSLTSSNKDFITNSLELDNKFKTLTSQKDEFWSKPKQLEELQSLKKQYTNLILSNQNTDLFAKKEELIKVIKSQLNESNQKKVITEAQNISTELSDSTQYAIELQKFDFFKARIDEVATDEKKEILVAEILELKKRNEPLLEFFAVENLQENLTSTKDLNSIIDKNQNNKNKSLEELKVIKLGIDEKYEKLIETKLELEAKKKAEEDRKKAEEQRIKELERLKQIQINQPEVDAFKLEPKLVFVSLANQTFTAYEYGVPIQSSYVTTGKDGKETVTGEFRIYEKKSPTVLISPFENEPYRTKVTYWMPFVGGYGLHDAPWRSEFGGEFYHVSGSHGCVNMPVGMAQWMYGWSEVGTKVIVQ